MHISEQKKLSFQIALLTFLALISWLPYLQTLFPHLSYGDEGVIVQSAYRIFNGQIPYQDFSTPITPAAYYWTALFFSFFGPTFLAVRLGTLVVAVAILLTTCLILKACGVRSSFAYLLASVFLVHFGGPYWFIASHHWVGLALSLISLLLLLPQSQGRTSSQRIILSGAFAAATAFALQHLGGLWILCAIMSFLGLPRLDRRKYFSCFVGGLFLITIPVAIYFAATAGISTVLYELVISPLTQYHKIDAHRGIDLSYFVNILEMISANWQLSNNLLDWVRFASILFLFLGILAVNLLPLLGLAGLIFLWRSATASRILLLFLTAFFSAQYLKVLFRFSDQTMVFAAPASLLIIILVFDQLRQRTPGNKAVIAFGSLWLGLFLCITAATLSFHIMAPRKVTNTPAGPVYSLSTADHETLQYLNRFFAERKKLGEPVFCHPYSPMLYFLFHADNPTSHDTLGYPSSTAEQYAEVIDQLEKNENQWVILTTNVQGDPLVRYFSEKYQVRTKLPLALVLEKRPEH